MVSRSSTSAGPVTDAVEASLTNAFGTHALPADLADVATANVVVVIADDLDLFPDALRSYLAYVRDPARGYVSVTLPVGDAMELSVRTG